MTNRQSDALVDFVRSMPGAPLTAWQVDFLQRFAELPPAALAKLTRAPHDCTGEWQWGNVAVRTGKFIPASSEQTARFWADAHNAPLARRCVGPVHLVNTTEPTE